MVSGYIHGGLKCEIYHENSGREESTMVEKKIPRDPVIRVSFVNTQLRDYYAGLEELCRDFEIDREELENSLKAAGYVYDKGENQFR